MIGTSFGRAVLGKRMRTVPGIGATIAAALHVYWPELGSLAENRSPLRQSWPDELR